jgi:hypothetical protein
MGTMTRLTPQQRWFLAEAAKVEWVSPRMFEGASKLRAGGNTSPPAVTMNSAFKALARLRDRGLLHHPGHNRAIFALTDAGRAALEEQP